MKILTKKILWLFIFAGFISGCGVYEPIDVVPDHIQTIRINPVKNKTQQIMLTSDLIEDLINEIVKEGRLTVVSSKDADSSLEITIIEYSRIPISYDEHFIAQEYKLNMIVNLEFNDHIKKLQLWEEVYDGLYGGVEVWVKYYPVGSSPVEEGGEQDTELIEFAETEEDARERLVEDVAEKIMQRLVYGWE